MKKRISILVVAGLLVGAYFWLRPRVVWLDGFDGTIQSKVEEQLPTVGATGGREISRYCLDVMTDSGRLVRVPVAPLIYYEAAVGMRVHKSPFSSGLELQGP